MNIFASYCINIFLFNLYLFTSFNYHFKIKVIYIDEINIKIKEVGSVIINYL